MQVVAEKFLKPSDKYEQTIINHPAKMGGVAVRDQIFHGEISEQLDDPNRKVGHVEISKGTPQPHIGRNKSGCLWKKNDGKKVNSQNVSLNRKSWA